MTATSIALPEADWDDSIDFRSAVAVVSGGMDSVTMAYLLRNRGVDLVTLAIDYRQRHRRELACAATAASRLGIPHCELNLQSLGAVFRDSALTDDRVAVPDGHYTDASMRFTIVPNRNAILLSVATALAVSRGLEAVAIGAHAGDHAIYPDCRPRFVDAFTVMARIANEGLAQAGFQIASPFIRLTKADIVRVGTEMGVPFADTWSCYRGGERHCGRCGTCFERREAFALAGVTDPTVYESARG